jgi:hypothetical protein
MKKAEDSADLSSRKVTRRRSKVKLEGDSMDWEYNLYGVDKLLYPEEGEGSGEDTDSEVEEELLDEEGESSLEDSKEQEQEQEEAGEKESVSMQLEEQLMEQKRAEAEQM